MKLSSALAAALTLGICACTTTETGEDVAAPEFADGSGQVDWNPVAEYPAVTGFELGSAVPNFKFVGYANFANPALAGQVQFIQMADLYNPDGTGVFGEGSPFGAGAPKPKAILLSKSAVWCPPCNVEADVALPGEYQKYQPMGGQFISVIVESYQGGELATYTDLFNWADDYMTGWQASNGSVYMLALDPTRATQQVQEAPWPGNLIIRTSDMKIMYSHAGAIVPDEVAMQVYGTTLQGVKQFWDTFEGVLTNTVLEPVENPNL
jgi:hypothetical protein